MIAQGLSNEELAELRELQEVHDLLVSPGWKLRIYPLLQAMVEEAQEKLLGATHAAADVKLSFLAGWQQRSAMLRDIELYIERKEEQRKRILDEIEERRKEQTGSLDGVPVEEIYA